MNLLDIFNRYILEISPQQLYRSTLYFGETQFNFCVNNEEIFNETLTRNKAFLIKSSSSININVSIFLSAHKLIPPETPKYEDSDEYFCQYIDINESHILVRQIKSNNTYEAIFDDGLEFWEIEQLLKLIINNFLIDHNALLIHGSVILRNNKFDIFTGPSGAGKSTASELSQADIIQDDTFGIQLLDDEEIVVFTIPFRRDYINRSVNAKMNGIYRIYQSKEDRIETVKASIQLLHGLNCLWSFDELSYNQKERNRKTIKVMKQLIQLTEIKELYFTKSSNFLQLI